MRQSGVTAARQNDGVIFSHRNPTVMSESAIFLAEEIPVIKNILLLQRTYLPSLLHINMCMKAFVQALQRSHFL